MILWQRKSHSTFIKNFSKWRKDKMQSLRAAGIHQQCVTSSAEFITSFPKSISCGPGPRPQMALTMGSSWFLCQQQWSWGHGLSLFISPQRGKLWVNNYTYEFSQIIYWIRLISDLNNNWVSLLPPLTPHAPLLPLSLSQPLSRGVEWDQWTSGSGIPTLPSKKPFLFFFFFASVPSYLVTENTSS